VLPSAYALIHEVGRLAADESVLVHSAAGGSHRGGPARARGGAAAVYGVVLSGEKVAYALDAGYDRVFVGEEYTSGIPEATAGRGVDLILDPVGGGTLRANLGLLARFGRLVSYGTRARTSRGRSVRVTSTPARRACSGSPCALWPGGPGPAAPDHRAGAAAGGEGRGRTPDHQRVPAAGSPESAPTCWNRARPLASWSYA